MIAVEHQQRPVGAQVERLRHRAQQRIGIGEVASILLNGIIALRQATGSVRVVRLHGDGHDKQRLPGVDRLLDLANDGPAHRMVADIGPEAISLAKGMFGDESPEAELRNGPVAPEETCVVRVYEYRAPVGAAEHSGERCLREPRRSQIRIETIHPLLGEGNAREHFDFGAMRVGAEAGNLEPALGQGPPSQAVEIGKIDAQAMPPQIGEGLGLDNNNSAVAAVTGRRRRAALLDASAIARAAPQSKAPHQRHRQTKIANELGGRGLLQLGETLHEARADASGPDHQRSHAAAGEKAGLRQGTVPTRFLRHPEGNESRDGEEQQNETHRLASSEIEQRRVANKGRDVAEIAEDQRFAQIAVFHARDSHEDAQRDEARGHREEGAGGKPKPQKPEPEQYGHPHPLYGGGAGALAGRRNSETVQPEPAHQKQRYCDHPRPCAPIHVNHSTLFATAGKLETVINTTVDINALEIYFLKITTNVKYTSKFNNKFTHSTVYDKIYSIENTKSEACHE